MRMFETDAVENMLVRALLEIRAQLRVFDRAEACRDLTNLAFQITGNPMMIGWPKPFYAHHLTYREFLRFSHVSIAFPLLSGFVLR